MRELWQLISPFFCKQLLRVEKMTKMLHDVGAYAESTLSRRGPNKTIVRVFEVSFAVIRCYEWNWVVKISVNFNKVTRIRAPNPDLRLYPQGGSQEVENSTLNFTGNSSRLNYGAHDGWEMRSLKLDYAYCAMLALKKLFWDQMLSLFEQVFLESGKMSLVIF